VIVAALLLSTAAYTVSPGDLLVRPVVGASVNVVRLKAATRDTPQGGMLLGVDLDWSFDGAWALTTAFRPVFSSDYVDANLGVGAKYRVIQLNAPFIPYASLMATTAVGGPMGFGDLHVNAGLRLAGGVDYWVMRDLAVGLEMAAETSHLFVPIGQPEVSTEILAGVTWRL
jgi:hypothetical protein